MTAPPEGGDNGLVPRVAIRPVGSPLPLGFLGLAVVTAVLACLNLGWIPTAEQHQVAVVLIAFAFPVQAVATVFCFLSRDAPAAAAIGIQGATWLTIGVLLLMSTPGTRSQTTAVFLFAAAAALIPSAISTLAGKLMPAVVMFGAAGRFALTGVYERLGGAGWSHVAGWEGLALGAVAVYVALASDLESTTYRSVLPLGRYGKGRAALGGDLREQSRDLHREPGIRRQL